MKKKKWHKKIGIAAAMLASFSMLVSCGKKEETVESLDTSKYVTLGEYSGMTIHVDAPQEITDEMVLNRLNTRLLSSYMEEVDVTDRAVISGDTVSYECVGRMDGEIFEGGSTPEGGTWSTTIGSGGMIPGFEDGIIGMEIGEVRDVVCTFPDPYLNNPDMSGKEAVFTITLRSITTYIYPELTAALLEEIGSSYATPEEAKADIRATLESAAQAAYEENIPTAIWSAVIANCEFPADPPEFLVKQYEDSLVNEYSYYASMYGYTDFAAFVQDFLGITEAQFNEQVTQISKTAAQETLIAEALADAVGIGNISDQELDAEAETFIATNAGFESIDELYEANSRDAFRSYVINARVMEWLTENNTITSN
ncbi:MAG: trigger factor [Lachnospiraceae bacterium]|nr:trigger factor [Lachnospiraceae bacterium]